MKKFANDPFVRIPERSELGLTLEGNTEIPTREEFYTNYPLYKYWSSEHNQSLLSPPGINIYIHIPFCIQICDYCFYMKELIRSKDQVDEYVGFLCKEIQLVSEQYSLSRKPVNSIYFGGGTPSVLTEPQFGRIMETLHRYHTIENPEFSIEVEPGTFSKNKLALYKTIGVNRISMGVQSFDDRVIQLSSRKHTAAQAIHSVDTIRQFGCFDLNIDLLSGLAGEDMQSWTHSLDTAVRQNADMVTIYKMKTYANTNFFMKGVHSKEITLPDDEKELRFWETALDTMLSAGYGMWSTFAFNKNNSQSRYIEHTWRNEDLIAYGASSFGMINHTNYQNLNNMKSYFERIAENKLPVYRSFALSFKDMIVKELLLCAARLFSYRKQEFIKKFGFDYVKLIPEQIDQLKQKGYITDDESELVLTRQGVLFADFVSKVIAEGVKNIFSKDKIGFIY